MQYYFKIAVHSQTLCRKESIILENFGTFLVDYQYCNSYTLHILMHQILSIMLINHSSAKYLINNSTHSFLIVFIYVYISECVVVTNPGTPL